MKRLLAIFARTHQPDREALSAYLDGELAPDRASALETHVASCDACTETLEGMRGVRSMLRALPEAEAPRSFRLRQADVEAAAPARLIPAPPSGLMRAMPVLSAAAIIVFAVAVGLDASGGGADSDNGASLSAMRQETAAYAEDGAMRNTNSLPNGGPPAEETPMTGADSAGGAIAPQPDAPEAATAADATANQGQPDVAASSVNTDDDDGNKLGFRIVEVTAAAVAIVAGGLALRTWRKRREGVA